MKTTELLFDTSFINGKWISATQKKFDVLNPANGEVISSVHDGGVKAVALAIKSAKNAQKQWEDITVKLRGAFLENLYDLFLLHKEELATIITRECGKPLKESLGEVTYAASFIKWFAEEGKRAYGDVIPQHKSENRILVTKQAVGVVAIITPWNFPLAMITRKLGAALAAGCAVVVRPSELTPLTALALARLTEIAGFPPGTINIVVGEDASGMGKVICDSPLVQKISFTGSTRVGKLLMKQGSKTLKKLSLELGGNAPFIVFEDANIDAAVAGAIASKFRNAGQTCVCTNRILVHKNVYNDFTKKLTEKVSQLKLGNGMKEGIDIGPIINVKAIKRITDLVKDAIDNGAKLFAGGKVNSDFFFEPTVIGNVTKRMKLAQEEIFGPIAPIYKFSTDEEAIKIANDTEYGLAAYFYTQDINRSWKVMEALEYGMVGINEGVISTEIAPFGGVKHSGFGREGSKYGLEEYLNVKYICYGGVE